LGGQSGKSIQVEKEMSRKPFEVTDEMIERLRMVMHRDKIALSTAIRQDDLSLHSFIKRCPEDVYWELFRYGRKCRYGESAKEVEPRHNKTPHPVLNCKTTTLGMAKKKSAFVLAEERYNHQVVERKSWDGRGDRDRMLGLKLKSTFKVDGALRPEVLKSVGKIVSSMGSIDTFNDTVDDELCLLEDLGFILREQRGAIRATLTVLFININNVP
jgi:hypothetical protein